MNRYKGIKLKGVTLLELMVVIAIIGIMSSVSIVSLHSLRTRARLKSAQSEVTATIKTAQSYALQGKQGNGTDIACGYGFRFTDDENYEIFYNKLIANDCDKQNKIGADRHHIGTSVTVFTGKLSDGVKLQAPASSDQTEMFFIIPYANIYDKGGNEFLSSVGASPLDFTFQLFGETRKITINKQMLITAN